LETVTVTLEPDLPAACPHGGRLRKIGEEVTEELDFVPAKLIELRVGQLQPLGPGGGLLGAKVSFQPLGVSCLMSLFGWLGSRRRMSWR